MFVKNSSVKAHSSVIPKSQGVGRAPCSSRDDWSEKIWRRHGAMLLSHEVPVHTPVWMDLDGGCSNTKGHTRRDSSSMKGPEQANPWGQEIDSWSPEAGEGLLPGMGFFHSGVKK